MKRENPTRSIRQGMSDPEDPGGFAMTPMIDITFQLTIFSILVTDFSRQNVERLTLPTATQRPRGCLSSLMVLNVLKDGTLKIDGKRVALSEAEKMFARRRKDPKHREPGSANLVKCFVYLRADRSTDFEHVQRILTMATRSGGVTRVVFAYAQDKRS